MSKGWDSNMLKKLKALIGKGLSTAEMGKKLGMSKNAVVGKLNRLGWNSKAVEPNDKKTVVKKTNSKKDEVNTNSKKAGVKTTAKKTVVKKDPKIAESKKLSKTTKIEKTTKQSGKTVKKELINIKTASKKTKKDLALHELLIQHALQMANLKPNQCRWPIGDPDSDNFHFCGETVFTGKPYCYEHCRQAYQFTSPKRK